MSRHRDIRNMDYTDEYEGYDDVYGHSMDDEIYLSPSNRQFMYNRENSTRSSEDGIKEEDEGEGELTDTEKSKLESCIDEVKNVLGAINIPRNELVDIILAHKFDIERTIDTILKDPKFKQPEAVERKEKDDRVQPKHFNIPKLNGLKSINPDISVNQFNMSTSSDSDINSQSKKTFPNLPGKGFTIPNIFNKNVKESAPLKPKNFIIPKLSSGTLNTNVPKFNLTKTKDDNIDEFSSLSELVSSHLKIPVECETNVTAKNRINFDTGINLNKSENEMASLQLSDTKSLSSVEQKSPLANDWHIDLSVALKSTNSLSSVPSNDNNHKSKLEKFDIPFVDCEGHNILSKNKKMLPCSLDVSSVLLIHSKYQKARSRFGRALCLNYKRYRPVINMLCDEIYSRKIKRFDFSTPSPDDIISSYVRR